MKRYVASHHKPLSVRRSERKTRNKLIFTVIFGLILTYVLTFWLLPTLIGGLSLINNFKPEPKKETPISENATLAPPVLSIPFEATDSSKINIDGYALPNSSVEIYLDEELKTTIPTKEDGSFLAENIELNLGINNLSGKTVDEKQQKSLSSKPIRIIYDNEKPKLEVNEPQDGKIVSDKRVTVSGTTDPTDITVTINDTRAIVNSEGKFSLSVEVQEGDNDITIKASDSANNLTQITRKVTLIVSPTPTESGSTPTP